MGDNFTFGKDRAGTSAELPLLAGKVDCRARVVPHVDWAGLESPPKPVGKPVRKRPRAKRIRHR